MNVKHFAITAEYWGAPQAAVPQIERKEWLKNQTKQRRDRRSALPAKPRASLYCQARREKCALKVYFEYKDVIKLELHIFTAQPRSLSLLNDTKQVKYTVVLKVYVEARSATCSHTWPNVFHYSRTLYYGIIEDWSLCKNLKHSTRALLTSKICDVSNIKSIKKKQQTLHC